jgi:acyl-lipid omega-6 desaturase (Delta-12 desaturase)
MARPIELDDLRRSSGLTLEDLRAAIPRECYRLEPLRSWKALVRTCILATGLFFLLSRIPVTPDWRLIWQVPALLGLWVLLACAFVGLFVIGHDCGHRAFSRRRWVNDLVGHLCMAPLLTGFHNWRIAHNYHHQQTQVRGQDPDWPERMVTLAEYRTLSRAKRLGVRLGFGSPAGLLLGFWVGAARRISLAAGYPRMPLSRGQKRAARLSTLAMLTGTGAGAALFWQMGGAWGLMRDYGAPVLIAALFGSLITLLHHSSADSIVLDPGDWDPLRGQVLATFQVRFPRLVEWLWLDINIHLPHHLSPRIPWYHLGAASEAIRRAYPAYHQERPFRCSDLRLLWSRPLLRRDEVRGLYTAAPLEE